jgi:cold shock CspA family protein
VMYGTIARVIHAHGFGFIRCSDGWEVFFHRSSLSGLDLNRLREGQEIEFEVQREESGPRALLVRPRRR